MTRTTIFLILFIWFISFHLTGRSQVKDSIWTLNACIEYALQKNVSIQKAVLGNETDQINLDQTRASRFPSLNASASQNFGWEREMTDNEYGSYTASNASNYGISSSVRLYNGFKINNSIRQSELTYKASQFDIETIKESVSLSILDAYLQVLYADEQVKNCDNQIVSTTEQLRLAEERLVLGAISKSDYLMVKSELATENLALANAQSLLITNKVNLMQLMELPVTSDFSIEYPDFSNNIVQKRNLNNDSVYQISLSIKPQIKSSEINLQISDLEIAIAKAGYQPVISLNGGLSTGYSSGFTMDYGYQMGNKINPSGSLTLSIPIYQNKQARSGVALAKINSRAAKLDDINTKNQLRKEIELACADVLSAEIRYEASLVQYNATQEAYAVAEEKYNIGLLNSVDFIIQKTNLINAESELLQSKYNLVFSYKVLDFYEGMPLTF
ncbi:MAG: TolC family protein [Bacteroidales bacterium]|nr:TolC family protein [Bacteroidales bacterium]